MMKFRDVFRHRGHTEDTYALVSSMLIATSSALPLMVSLALQVLRGVHGLEQEIYSAISLVAVKKSVSIVAFFRS